MIRYKNFTKIFLSLLLSLFSIATAKADETILCGLTNMGHVVPVSDIQCLVADEGSSTLSICLNSGKTIANVNSLALDYRDTSTVNSLATVEDDKVMIFSNNVIEISMLSKNEKILLIDLQGRAMWSGKSDGTKTTINISAYPAGYYLLQAGKITYKFLKK